MTRNTFFKILARAGAAAGIGDVHPHLLRHGTGFRLVNQGLDTLALAAYLGHRSVQNTKRYAKMNATRFDGLWKDNSGRSDGNKCQLACLLKAFRPSTHVFRGRMVVREGWGRHAWTQHDIGLAAEQFLPTRPQNRSGPGWRATIPGDRSCAADAVSGEALVFW